MSDTTATPQRIEGFADMTPSQRVLAMANRVLTATDANGRTIRFRTLKALDRMRLKRMAGPDAINDAFMEDVFAAASVVQLGEDKVDFPNSIRECEAIINRLDDIGLVAMSEAAGALVAPSADEVKADAKN